jgi:hypothetical protein
MIPCAIRTDGTPTLAHYVRNTCAKAILGLGFIGLLVLAGCAATPHVTIADSAAMHGALIVYSATYPQTLEQSEYPAHTDYTIATTDDRRIERVANNTGSFGSYPATIELPCGKYHVRAQYTRGGFAVVPVSILADRTTVLDLSGEPLPAFGAEPLQQPIRRPDGTIIGWRATGK